MAHNLNARVARLERAADRHSPGPVTAILTEAWRRHREGLPPQLSTPEQRERWPPVLRAAWQRGNDGRV